MRAAAVSFLYRAPLLGKLLRERAELSARVAELETQNGLLQDDLRRQQAIANMEPATANVEPAIAPEAELRRLTSERNRAIEIAVESGRALIRNSSREDRHRA